MVNLTLKHSHIEPRIANVWSDLPFLSKVTEKWKSDGKKTAETM